MLSQIQHLFFYLLLIWQYIIVVGITELYNQMNIHDLFEGNKK